MAADMESQWELSISVKDLPAQSPFILLHLDLNLSEIIAKASLRGCVDTATLVLEKAGARVPSQFISSDQPRLQPRPLLPSTSPNVSFAGEFAASEVPPQIQSLGTIYWVTSTDQETKQEFSLHFSLVENGTFVQVPYPPGELQRLNPRAETTPRPFAAMQIHPQWPLAGEFNLSNQTNLIATYHLGPLTDNAPMVQFRRPFLHPVVGPDGIDLTEFGKPHDSTGSHAHHYGLWIAHNSVNGVDFWSERGGLIRHERLLKTEDGPVFCGVKHQLRWEHEGKSLMKEIRSITAYKTPSPFRLLDFDLEFSPCADEPVTLGRTSFGFLAARVAQSMSVFDGGGRIENSNGDLNEHGAHLKRANWIDQSGPITGEKWGGITIMDSPQNLGHPCGFHCRNDGWACASFNMEQPYAIEPGKSLRLRYRVLLHSGNARQGGVAELYRSYDCKPATLLSELKRASPKP